MDKREGREVNTQRSWRATSESYARVWNTIESQARASGRQTDRFRTLLAMRKMSPMLHKQNLTSFWLLSLREDLVDFGAVDALLQYCVWLWIFCVSKSWNKTMRPGSTERICLLVYYPDWPNRLKQVVVWNICLVYWVFNCNCSAFCQNQKRFTNAP